MADAFVRTICPQPDAAWRQLREVAIRLARDFPKTATELAEAEGDVTVHPVCPRHQSRKIWSTNPLQRVTQEIKRRTNVVGVFPNDDAVLRLFDAILAAQHDDWQTSDRRYLAMNRTLTLDFEQTTTLGLETA